MRPCLVPLAYHGSGHGITVGFIGVEEPYDKLEVSLDKRKYFELQSVDGDAPEYTFDNLREEYCYRVYGRAICGNDVRETETVIPTRAPSQTRMQVALFSAVEPRHTTGGRTRIGGAKAVSTDGTSNS